MKIFKRSVGGVHVELLAKLNCADRRARLQAAQELAPYAEQPGSLVNLCLQTSCSGAEYSPSMTVWRALESGLGLAGLSDRETVEGAREFVAAAGALNLPVTVGMECRCGVPGRGTAQVALHGIPHNRLPLVDEWLAPYKERTAQRDVPPEELPPVSEVVALARRVGAVPAYILSALCPEDSPGRQIAELYELGFRAVRYAPDLLLSERLQTVRSLCRTAGFLELCGAEHNGEPENAPFCDAAWALIGQERRAMENRSDSLFSDETAARLPRLPRRVGVYRDYAKRLYGVNI